MFWKSHDFQIHQYVKGSQYQIHKDCSENQLNLEAFILMQLVLASLINAQELFWKPGEFETGKKITQVNKGHSLKEKTKNKKPAIILESPLKKVNCSR